MAATHANAVKAGLRRNAFDWSGTSKAIKRLARTDPALSAFCSAFVFTSLYWMARGAGYELTAAHLGSARDHTVVVAEAIGVGAIVRARITDNVAGVGPAAVWVRTCLGIEA